MTLKSQLAVFAWPSMKVYLTGVVPTPNKSPVLRVDEMVNSVVTPSEAVGSVHVTGTGDPSEEAAVTSPGQEVTLGGEVSVRVSANIHSRIEKQI